MRKAEKLLAHVFHDPISFKLIIMHLETKTTVFYIGNPISMIICVNF